MIQETIGTTERDKLWMLAIFRILDVDGMSEVLSEFIKLREKNTTVTELMKGLYNEQ